MPATTSISRFQYPRHGWASYFGRISATPGPWAFPYAFWVVCPQADGIFEPMRRGRWFRIEDEFPPNDPTYFGDSAFSPFSSLPYMTFSPLPDNHVSILFQWYYQAAPLVFYNADASGEWANPRKPIMVENNGFWVPAIFPSTIGDDVELHPYNRGAYEKYS